MSFRSWRERKLLSQEKVAEMSGLSLRTVQRLEAGHRVSYSSLRALSTAFDNDVDALERELYAMTKPEGEFVEIPRWVRLMNDRMWFGGTRLSRRDVGWVEAGCAACALVVFTCSFLVDSEARADSVRWGAVIAMSAGYLVSVFVRVHDKYRLWPAQGDASAEAPRRSWRGTAAEYAFFLAAAALGIALMGSLLTR